MKKAVEGAKAADETVDERPYQAIGENRLESIGEMVACTEKPAVLTLRLVCDPPTLVLEWPLNASCYQA